MNAKSKAEELVGRCTFKCRECDYDETAKYCANLVVDEMIKEINRLDNKFSLKLDGTIQYWNEVKKEIELL